jgi:hypothetical protein
MGTNAAPAVLAAAKLVHCETWQLLASNFLPLSVSHRSISVKSVIAFFNQK